MRVALSLGFTFVLTVAMMSGVLAFLMAACRAAGLPT